MTTRCVCAAALTQTQTLYGHLEGHTVWAAHTQEPGSCYRGTLRVLTDMPGYVRIDRGDSDRDKTWHYEDVSEITPVT